MQSTAAKVLDRYPNPELMDPWELIQILGEILDAQAERINRLEALLRAMPSRAW